MTYKTHLIGGLQAGTLLAYAYGGTTTESALLLGASLLGSMLPDIDKSTSKIAGTDAAAWAASKAISRVAGHRGITHTIIGAVIFSALFFCLAVFGSSSENIIALYSAAAALIVFNAAKIFRRYGLIAAAAVYILSPRLVEMIKGEALSLNISADTALLCAAGIFAGCISHMIYDTFNRAGIMWAWPLSRKKISLGNIRGGSFGESIFALLMACLFSVILIYVFRETSAYRITQQLVHEIRIMLSF